MVPRKSAEEIKARFEGPVNSIPTPFLADGEIDWDGVKKIIDIGIEGGSAVSLTTAGDSRLMYLADDELAEYARLLVEHAAGRAVTVMATPLCGTRRAIRYAELYRQIGVDMIMPTPISSIDGAALPQGTVDFYRAVSEVLATMIVGCPPDEVLDGLLEAENVIAFKEDGSEAYAIRAVVKYSHRYRLMTGGSLWWHYTQWPYGCRAFFSCYHSFRPDVGRRYWQALQGGDDRAAVAILRDIDIPLFKTGCAYPGGFQPFWRAVLKLFGVASHDVRSPMVTLSDEQIEKVRDDLKALGLLA